jgi:hypothetical protein
MFFRDMCFRAFICLVLFVDGFHFRPFLYTWFFFFFVREMVTVVLLPMPTVTFVLQDWLIERVTLLARSSATRIGGGGVGGNLWQIMSRSIGSVFTLDKTYFLTKIKLFVWIWIIIISWSTMILSYDNEEWIYSDLVACNNFMVFNTSASYFHENLFHYSKDYLMTKLTRG